MDLSKFLSMIGKKTLYFASAESFEDIFEGAKGTLELKEKWDAFYLNFFKEAIQTAPGMKPEDLTAEYIEENAIRLLSELNASENVKRKHTFSSLTGNGSIRIDSHLPRHSFSGSRGTSQDATLQSCQIEFIL